MDPELKAALGNITEHMQRNADAQEATQRSIGQLVERVERVEKHVGLGPSDPPPPTKLAQLASSNALEVEALSGRMISLESKVDANHTAVTTELKKQSSAMGIGIRGLRWLRTSEGRAVVVRLATLAAIAYITFMTYVHGAPVFAQPPQPLPAQGQSR